MKLTVVPDLAGLLLIGFGIWSALGPLLQRESAMLVSGLRFGIGLAALGIALRVAARAIQRRSRIGYVLGFGIAMVSGLPAIGALADLIPKGDRAVTLFGAGIGNLVISLVGIVVAASLGYAAAFWFARKSFEMHWAPDDRRTASALAALMVVSGGLFVGLGALEGRINLEHDAQQAGAVSLADATTFEVRVINATVAPAPDGGAPLVVEHLTIDITLRSPQAYSLQEPPTLCLTDLVTYREIGKPVFCWGSDGAGQVLDQEVAGLTISPTTDTIRLELDRGLSICPFAGGRWSATLAIVPRGGLEASPMRLLLETTFEVDPGLAASAPLASGSAKEPTACTGLPATGRP